MKRSDITDLMVVQAYDRATTYAIAMRPFAYEILAEETGAPEKICLAACERACDHGLIDYGVSLRAGFLTDKGRQLLRDSQ